MKHRISYSVQDQLYKVETKKAFGKWEARQNYLYTDINGNFVNAKGFFTYEHALEWLNDRHPNFNQFHKPNKNENISFEF